MSYGDPLRSTTPLMSDAAALIEGLLVPTYRVTSVAFSTASTSHVVVTGLSQSITLLSGQTALIYVNASLSHASASNALNCAIYAAGSQLSSGRQYTSVVGTTGGADGTLQMTERYTVVGTNTIDFRMKVGSGTGYCGDGLMIIGIFRSS